MRPSFLIDDNGRMHHAESLLLRQRTGGVWAGDAFGQYAVCNLGYVGGAEHSRAVQLYVRPASVTAEAYVQAIYLLRDLEPGHRVVLSTWRDGAFSDELHRDGASAAAALTGRVSERHAQSRARLKSREVTLTEAPDVFLRCLAALGSGRQQHGGAAVDATTFDAVSTACDGRYVVFGRTDTCFVLHSYGLNNPAHAMHWYEGNVGAPLRKDLDLEYSWFCNAAYRRALVRRRPLIEAVDALVELPRREKMRRRYYRLIVPLGDATRPLVFIATIEDCGIDLLAA
ncbi:MAG: hypothetical protein R3D27_07985 [Hyphomicrobiaceae bacterium]